MQSALIIVILSATILSCNREGDIVGNGDPDPSTAKTVAETTKSFDDAVTMSEEALIQYLNDSTFSEYAFGECLMITYDAAATKITFDLGTDGCTGLDGKTRKGKIMLDYNGVPREPGSTMEITFDDYFVDGYQLSGDLTYNCLSENANGNLEISYVLTGGNYTEPSGTVITLASMRTVEWTAGVGSDDLFDDEFTTTGSFSGSIDGEAFSGNTTNPVIYHSACWAEGIYYAVSGTWSLDFNDAFNRSIDYGDGECDKDIVIKIGVYEYDFTLP